ncbi:hypothetical protein C2S51_038915 [Perilla frutescens var. frutescens]|nr:hypothetical protein C2S51_038915 [Perilla frutescens var. frutescens]
MGSQPPNREINGNGSQSLGSINSHTGSKGLNQDCAIIYEGYGVEDGAFCAVFDGHGKNGHIVSKIVRNRLPSLLLSQRNSIAKISPSTHNSKLGSDHLGQDKNFLRWKDACVSAFKAVDREIKFLNTLDCSCSGTTASVVIKQVEITGNSMLPHRGEDLIVANLGDSRAVLGTRTESGIIAVQLTTDLKPGVPCKNSFDTM